MDINKLKELGREYFQKGKEVTLDLTEKAAIQVKLLNLENKIQKEERALGKVVYKLVKESVIATPEVLAKVANIDDLLFQINEIKKESEKQEIIEKTSPAIYEEIFDAQEVVENSEMPDDGISSDTSEIIEVEIEQEDGLNEVSISEIVK